MKMWKNPKKIIFLVMTFICIVRIGYIVIGGEIEKQYGVSASVELLDQKEVPCIQLSQTFRSRQKHLDRLELMFSGVPDDKQGAVILKITRNLELIYQAKLSLENLNNNEWKQVRINMPVQPQEEYVISLYANENCTKPPNIRLSLGAPEAVVSKQGPVALDDQLAIQYGYLQPPGRLDKAVCSIVWVCLWFGGVWALCYFDQLVFKAKQIVACICRWISRENLTVILEFLCCLIILNCSGIVFQEQTKIIFYVISFAAAVKFSEKTRYVAQQLDHTWKKILLISVYFYAAFALVGQRILIYPLTLKVTISGGYTFLLTVCWFIPVINSVIYGWGHLERIMLRKNNKELGSVTLGMILFVLMLAPAAYHLFANNPGISSPDTVACMVTNAHHLHGMYDWHPAFYCMALRLILTVWDSTYAVIFMQYLFWAYVVIEILLYLRKKGIKDGWVIGIASFFGINAGNFVHLNTIWKDVPYAISLLWVFIIVVKLAIDQEIYNNRRYIYFELILALTGTYFYRKNGVVSVVIVVIATAVVLRKNRRLWISIACTAIVIGLIKGPVYSYLQIQETGRQGMYIGMGQDILGVYYAGGEVSEQTLQMITIMTEYNNAEYSYSPTWSGQSYDLDVEPLEFIVCYLKTFIRNPILMSRAVVDREDAVWDIFAGQDSILGCVNYFGTMDDDSEWSKYYPKRIYRSMYDSFNAKITYTAESQWISAVEWRSGLFTLLGIIAFASMLLKRGTGIYLLMFSPIIGHLLSLVLSTGWSDFRYFWPLNLMNLCIILFVPIIHRLR